MNKQLIGSMKAHLANDENSSDEELVALFIEEGATEKEAQEWIAKRSFYSLNMVIHDEDGNDIGIYDPKTRTWKSIN